MPQSNPGTAQEYSASATIGLQSQVSVPDPTDPKYYINPPADARLISILSKTNSQLKRGIIQQTDDMASGDQKFPFACEFIFNPGEIDVSYSLDQTQTPPGDLTPAQLAATAFYAGTTQISFSLLFDRTYECYYPPRAGVIDISDVGCYIDIAMLEYITGVRAAFTENAVNLDDGTGTGTNTTAPTGGGLGNMLYVPAYVIFGGGNGDASEAAVPGLSYVGFITDMQVNYAMFTERMVPSRCGVSITMQQLVGNSANDYQLNGGTLIDRLNAYNKTTTASGRS
jgi:hypothetical protein